MPGYTKQQLVDNGKKLTSHAWCRSCRLYWHKAGLNRHRAACERNKVSVRFDSPPSPKPKKGDIVILHPAHQQFLDFLVEGAFRQILEEQRQGTSRGAKPELEPEPPPRERSAAKERDYEVLTVDEAVARFGVTREEVMAEFDEVMRRHQESREASPKKKGRGKRGV